MTIESHFEVERKFRVSDQESKQVVEKLNQKSFTFVRQIHMTDTFLPPRAEGELLRLRIESEEHDTKCILTTKTWVAPAGGVKERLESEEEVKEMAAKTLLRLGRLAKGGNLLSYSKVRDVYQGQLQNRRAEVCLDEVEGLGDYSGHYIEIEVLVGNEGEVPEVRHQIMTFAAELLGDLRHPESLTYKDMLEMSLHHPAKKP